MNKELQAFKKRFSFEEYCKTDLDFWESVNNRVEDLPGEEWREIPGWCCFEISNYGRVKRPLQERCYGGNTYPVLYAEKILKLHYDKQGYAQVTLKQFGRRGTFYVHRLVLIAFEILPPSPEHTEVNHKDQNPRNNRLENLEWVTPDGNKKYGNRAEKISESLKTHYSIMSKEQINENLKPAHEARKRKVKCENKIYNSVKEFTLENSLNYQNVIQWLLGINRMPQKWQEKGLQYI